MQLRARLRLAAAGAVVGVVLGAGTAKAQSPLGPFERNYIDNPLPPPLPFYNRPKFTYADLDGDGDQDLVIGGYSGLIYYKNIGTAGDPYFLEINSGEDGYPFSNVSLPSPYGSATPAFADVDGDGDLDLLVGAVKYSSTGALFFYRNGDSDGGNSTSPDFNQDTDNNPFVGVNPGDRPYPAFADVDGDSDLDLIIGGYYSASTYFYLIQFYKNEQETPGTPVYVQHTGIENPFFFEDITRTTYETPLAFADLDGDGDLDFFFR